MFLGLVGAFTSRLSFLKDLSMLLFETQLGVYVVTHIMVNYQQPNVTPPVHWDQEHVVGCLGAQSTKQPLQPDRIWDVLSTLMIEIYLC